MALNLQNPWFIKGLNTGWKVLSMTSQPVKLERDDLISRAKKKTGLTDLGDFWIEPLDRLVQSINQEAQLTPFGRFITRERLTNLLQVRLLAESYFKKYPEILKQELYPVWMIAALQRTGTTKLQRLLASDPDNRSLYSWEALNPAPLTGKNFGKDKRLAAAKQAQTALKTIAPAFFSIHPVDSFYPIGSMDTRMASRYCLLGICC